MPGFTMFVPFVRRGGSEDDGAARVLQLPVAAAGFLDSPAALAGEVEQAREIALHDELLMGLSHSPHSPRMRA
jgi:hypothetical protein